MSTSLEQSLKNDQIWRVAERSAMMIVNGPLRDFIPPRFLREAVHELSKALLDNDMELTSLQQRREFDEMRKLTIDLSAFKASVE